MTRCREIVGGMVRSHCKGEPDLVAQEIVRILAMAITLPVFKVFYCKRRGLLLPVGVDGVLAPTYQGFISGLIH